MTKVSFFLINDKQGGVCSHTLLCDYHELLEDLLHFFFQPVHMPVNRLFGNLQIPGYFMSAIPLDLHQNDLKGKPVHGDQYMIQFLILNTLYDFTNLNSFLTQQQVSQTKNYSFNSASISSIVGITFLLFRHKPIKYSTKCQCKYNTKNILNHSKTNCSF